MRKLLLSGFALFTAVGLMAQSGSVSAPRLLSKIDYKTVENNATGSTGVAVDRPTAARGSSRTVSTVALGTSGNPFTIINSGVNQVSYNTSTNQVLFVHRTDNKKFVGDDANNGQYRYDVSTDGGATWTIDHGLLNPSGTQAGFACRFPNALIYNPTGNTDPNNSYINYIGSFHDGGTNADWQGYCHGRGQLNNSVPTYTERRYTPNSSNTNIASSLIQSKPGTFWAVDEYIVASDGTNPTGISVYKGVWNADSNATVWTAPLVLNPPLDNTADGETHINGTQIAFDPSGKYGWIVASADVTNDGEGTFDPILYKTTDSGLTWSSMIALDLDSINGIVYDPINGPASTSFELGITVDINGNPHIAVVVLPGSTTTPFSVLGNAPDKYLYDITFDPTFNVDCQWRAIRLDFINSLRKDVVAGSLTMDNYLKASRTEDGTKVFFSWVDSDSSTVGLNQNNDLPDFKMIGLDVVAQTRTAPKNFTVGDAIWEGDVLWPQTSTLVRNISGTYNIPTVFSRMNAALNDLDTCYFHYVSNINFTSGEFSAQLDNQAPDITVLGDTVVWVAVGSGPYADPGATANDCYDGDLTDSISVVSTVNTSAAGVYTITYTVTDAAGNTATATRTVRVATAPNCTFTIVPSSTIGGRFNFQYANPGGGALSWTWNYGNGGGVSNTTNGNIVYSYTTNGTYTVRFCATNPIGTCCDSQTINVTNVSVQDINLNNNISVYPNPANDVLNVSIDVTNASDATIKIVNIVGAEVYTKALGSINGTLNEKINVSNLESGIYFLKLQTATGSATKKITVSRN